MTAYYSAINWLCEWNLHLMLENDRIPLTDYEWGQLSKQEYREFLLLKQTGQLRITPKSPPPAKAVDLVANFKKGIKRDASLYPVLKDQRQWNNWQRSMLAQAHAHDIQDVFDPGYEPQDDEQERLFTEKNKFAYAVLNRVVQTDEGKAFVCQYEKTYDAHAVYSKLVDFATKSTAAELGKDSLIKYLTTIKLDSRWSGTTVGFILHWCEQVRLLDDMSSDTEQFSAGPKENAGISR